MNNIGIDEALIHQGKKKNILTFSIQDFLVMLINLINFILIIILLWIKYLQI